MFKKLLAVFFLFCLSIQLITSPARAVGEFYTSYDINYTVQTSGITKSKYNITLTNKLSNIYATEFTISVGSTQIKNISAYDQQGSLETKIDQGDKTTNITIPFKQKVVGKDKSHQFNLEFDSLDFANQLGSVWEISIPKLSKTEDLKTYDLNLNVPTSLGAPAFISPQPINQLSQSGYTTYQFSQTDLLEKGVSATFGRYQYFDFSLTYHLVNPNIYPTKTEIALPPDSSFQKLIYQTLQPPPSQISVDQDGNWLALYQLGPKQELEITATGSAEIHLTPRQDYPQYVLEDLQSYLNEQKYWEIFNPKLQDLAEQLTTPREIYHYVVNNLIYDYGRLGETTTRYGAANAIDNQDSAICTEFTDLFVSLARAAGIPARAVNGFAYTTNSALRPLSLQKDVLHAWPEYYDQTKSLWIPVDPTWGNTTNGIDYFNQLDLNHFSFVFLGQHSNYPIPAGAYKTINDQNKDININFGNSTTPSPSIGLEINLAQRSIAGLPVNGSIVINNTGNVALYNQDIYITAKQLQFSENHWQIAVLPPFSSHSINFTIPATAWTKSFSGSITVTSDLDSISHSFQLVPLHSFIIFNPLTFQIAGAMFSLLAFWLARKLVIKYSS